MNYFAWITNCKLVCRNLPGGPSQLYPHETNLLTPYLWNNYFIYLNPPYFKLILHNFTTDNFVTQFLTVHSYYKDYLERINHSSCGLCDCGQDRENYEHLLFHFRNFISQRETLLLELRKLSIS